MFISTDELLELIKACKAARATNLKIGDVEIRFADRERRQTKEKVREIPIPTAKELSSAEDDARIKNNLELVDDDVATMHVEDPSEFERLIVERELKDRAQA